jgi:hypothetical protein
MIAMERNALIKKGASTAKEVDIMKSAILLVLTVIILSLLLSSCFLLDYLKGGYEKATEIVVQDVLPQQLSLTPNATYICSRLQSSVASGTIIVPDNVRTSAKDESNMIIRQRLVAKGESYFFYLDLNPGAFYSHPVKYILVSKSGSVDVLPAEWLPRINGEVPPELNRTIPSTDLVVKSNITLYRPSGIHLIYKFPLLRIKQSEGIIVVQGLNPNENLFSNAQDAYLEALNFFKAYRDARPSGTVGINGLVQTDAAHVLEAIDAMADKYYTVTIYIIAHGSVNAIRLGGSFFTSYQFRDKLAAYPRTTFNFLLGSCHSGSFIDDLSSLSNVRLILTAARTDESAWPDWDSYGSASDYNPSDVGTEWTSSIFWRAKSIIESSTKWAAVQNYANAYNIPITSAVLYQAHWGALGMNSTYGFYYNLDLCNRVNKETPQVYRSW